MRNLSRWVLLLYSVYLIVPLYWLATMALKANADIVGSFSSFPAV